MGKTIPLSPDQGLYEGIRRYGATQQNQAAIANASTDNMLQRAVLEKEALAREGRQSEQDYRRYRAKGKADIENYKDAEAAGLPVGGAQGRATGVPSLRKSSYDFRRGLQEGGIHNNAGLAAFMSHAQSESQFNPLASNTENGEDSHGIMQTNHGRNTQRIRWIQQNGGNPDDPYWQGRYAAWENTKGPERAYNVNNARTLQEANTLLAQSQRYNPAGGAAAETARRFNLAQQFFKKMTGEKPGQLDAETRAAAALEGSTDGVSPAVAGTPADPYPHIDPSTGKKYRLADLNTVQIEQAKINAVPGMDRVALDIDAPPNPKTGRVPYRIYDPNPATPVPVKVPVPQVNDPVPVPAPMPAPAPGQQAQVQVPAETPAADDGQPVDLLSEP